MNKIIHIILFTIISFSFTISSTFADEICYKANKNNFTQTPGMPHDIIFDLSDLKKKSWIHLSFASLLPIPYADSSYSFYCMQKKSTPNTYKCVGECDTGRMHIRIEDAYLSVNVKFATMTNTPDDPIMHTIKSKQNKFTRADRTVCPKPHIFKSKEEKNLPFVCYSWKGQYNSEEDTLQYYGCTRHNQSCKSIEAKHFGKYQNDYESNKAYLRCENSKPRLNVVKKNRKKELLQSMTIKDVTIYDLDYYNNLVIAVGEDASAKTRKLQSMDEYHEAVMLKSTDAGKSWSKIGKNLESSIPHDTVIVLDEKRIVIASSIEGAGGYITLSEDAGKHWETRYDRAFIESMKHIEGDTILAKTTVSTIKSIDGGKNWVEISSK